MIIVTQDRKEIINFDNVINIKILIDNYYDYESDEEEEKNQKYDIYVGTTVSAKDNYRIIGTYKTKERAQEVLNEMVNYFSVPPEMHGGYEKLMLEIEVRKLARYEMPQS